MKICKHYDSIAMTPSLISSQHVEDIVADAGELIKAASRKNLEKQLVRMLIDSDAIFVFTEYFFRQSRRKFWQVPRIF